MLVGALSFRLILVEGAVSGRRLPPLPSPAHERDVHQRAVFACHPPVMPEPLRELARGGVDVSVAMRCPRLPTLQQHLDQVTRSREAADQWVTWGYLLPSKTQRGAELLRAPVCCLPWTSAVEGWERVQTSWVA